MCFSIIKVISVRINPPQVVIPRTYMLHFVKNFLEDRTFKVIIGDTKSEKMTIEWSKGRY
jgi:uncharacterized lipoprotein